MTMPANSELRKRVGRGFSDAISQPAKRA